jgi:hypothetical protein
MRDKNKHLDKDHSLEAFAQQNRAAFDELEPIDENGLWNAIQPELPLAVKPISGWKIELGAYWKWSAVACIALLFAATIYWMPSSSQPTPTSVASYFPELKETQIRYQRLIKQKEVDLNLTQIDPSAHQDIFYELKVLDEIYAELLAELPAFAEQEQVKKILLRYYERKLKTLDILSKEIQRQQKQDRYVEDNKLM